MPKAGTTAYPYSELQSYWETSIRPLFEEDDLVQQYLVPLDDSAIIARLNAVLQGSDSLRRKEFQGSRVSSSATVGMLVESMDKKHPSDIVFEFKPKWLSQSPSAPPSAVRCRNCAREVQKRNSKPSPPPPNTDNPIDCPLMLLDPPSLTQSLSTLLSPSLPSPDESTDHYRTRLSHWLQTNTLLPRLRFLQQSNDPLGPLAADPSNPAFQLAMTLRDCSVFIRIPADPTLPVEACIADLDKKNWEAKTEYWRATERGLIEDRYYEGKEMPRWQTNCLLEREKGAERQ